MINDDGRCYAFDSRGSGYGRSEGVATIILKRLDDAIKAGDPIRAVIRNTGVNSDGKTNGIMLPSSAAQQSLMDSVYRSSGINPRDVGYIELHGTVTMAGNHSFSLSSDLETPSRDFEPCFKPFAPTLSQ